jgi:4-hydroxy-tetrahydrodipicolinate synthase
MVTPFLEDGAVDLVRLREHALWLIGQGCDSVTLFGTTGEGASVGLNERQRAIGAVASVLDDPRRQLILGVAAATIEETLAQASAGYAVGCRALLLAPPFYFSGGEDGLFGWFSAVFTALGSQARDIILYHIPALTRNPISIALTKRLAASFPGVVIGVKDSDGNWPNTEARLRELTDFQVLVGDERHLARAIREGGSGAICGTSNFAPKVLRELIDTGRENPQLTAMVNLLVSHPVVPAVKAGIAGVTGDAAWLRVRPPLEPLSGELAATLYTEFVALLANSVT